MEVSSLVGPSDKKKDIKGRFKEIKMRNENLKAETYAQYLKLTPPNQTRLMSAFDIKVGKMLLSFLQPNVKQPQTLAYYKKTNFEVLARDVHPIDQIEFHKKAGEMIYSTLIEKFMDSFKLKDSLDNVIAQCKLEKASSQAKYNKIKSLEDLVIKLGHDPSDIKATKKLIKKKNEDITTLKKQLKIPPSQNPWTKEVLESQRNHEEMMDLVL